MTDETDIRTPNETPQAPPARRGLLTRWRGPAAPAPSGGGSILGGLPTRTLASIGFVAVAGWLALQSFFTVDPAERAMVRMLGQVTSEKPLGPGLHFRVPLISQVDRARSQ